MIKKIFNFKFPIRNYQEGMTYVELIVVLSIFSLMSSIVIFNYGAFQAKVDIKNLASDIALKMVESQKSSLSGRLPSIAGYGADWKPSFGVFFDISSNGSNKALIYYADTNQDGYYNGFDTQSFCPIVGSDECLEKINITKGNYISSIGLFDANDVPVVIPGFSPMTSISLNFKRPDSGMTVSLGGIVIPSFSYLQITVNSPSGKTAKIKSYVSGRIQID